MAETYQEGSGAGADFDLSQFYQIFFEEAGENLDQMEQMLLDLDLSNARRRRTQRHLPLRAFDQGRLCHLRVFGRRRVDPPDGVSAGSPAPP